MILKVLSVVEEKIIRNNEDNSTILDNRINGEESFHNKRYYTFSIIAKSNTSAYGVHNKTEDTYRPLEEELEKRNADLVRMRFVIIDRDKNYIYYDGNKDDVLTILNTLFNVERKSVQNNVDPNEIKKLTKLKIISRKVGQQNISDLDYQSNLMKDIEVMFDRNSVRKEVYELEFKREGSRFNQRAFDKMYQDSKEGLVDMSVEGIDNSGHRVNLSSVISKKIEILRGKSSWVDRISLELVTVLDALIEEVEK